MKKLTPILLLIFLLCYAGVLRSADKVDKNIDFGSAINTSPLTHPAVYDVLKAKGVSCEGLETKDGYIRIINASADVTIAPSEIQAEIDKIKAEQDIEVLIQKEIRKLAIDNLKKEGKISVDYIDKNAK